ncbi:MAG: hypothetical protein GY769_07750 [bacterium]|nr:hypothetical protein [bacterium]
MSWYWTEICPTCNGTGRVPWSNLGTAFADSTSPCPACKGKGMIEHSTEDPPPFPVPPEASQQFVVLQEELRHVYVLYGLDMGEHPVALGVYRTVSGAMNHPEVQGQGFVGPYEATRCELQGQRYWKPLHVDDEGKPEGDPFHLIYEEEVQP